MPLSGGGSWRPTPGPSLKGGVTSIKRRVRARGHPWNPGRGLRPLHLPCWLGCTVGDVALLETHTAQGIADHGHGLAAEYDYDYRDERQQYDGNDVSRIRDGGGLSACQQEAG